MIGHETSRGPDRLELDIPGDSVRLVLAPQDADDYFGLIAQDPEHLSQHGDETADKYPDAESVRDSILYPNNPKKYRFGIWDNGVMVGSNNLTPMDESRAELGSWVGKEYIGQGYAGRARAVLVDFAFNSLNLQEVYCDIVVGNVASRRSVEKSGFEFNGELEGADGLSRWRYSLQNPKRLSS